jgi:hypothetical protein
MANEKAPVTPKLKSPHETPFGHINGMFLDRPFVCTFVQTCQMSGHAADLKYVNKCPQMSSNALDVHQMSFKEALKYEI